MQKNFVKNMKKKITESSYELNLNKENYSCVIQDEIRMKLLSLRIIWEFLKQTNPQKFNRKNFDSINYENIIGNEYIRIQS